MFKRSRKKIILSIMSSLVLLFVITLSVIMLASYRELRMRDSRMLDRFAESYDPYQQNGAWNDPGMAPDRPELPPGEERRDFQLSTFYSVALAEDGSVLAVDNGEKDVYTTDELTAMAKSILSESKSGGRIGNLSYVVRGRQGYTLVAFMDNTVTESSLSMLLRNVLIIGGASIIVLFFIALILANRIIRPLEENDRKQKQFISDASHELKTPVAVIGANADLLSRELGDNEWLANIQYENDRMGELVRQLLDLSRAESAEPVMEPLDLSRIVMGEVLAFESLAFEQGKTIRSDIPEDLRVTGSQSLLTQLVSILLDNALRHSTGDEISVTLQRQGHTVMLTVSNEGAAIPPEKLEHLFDRFYRVDEARNSEGRHYGLGLSIAKAAAEKHGGSIDVTSGAGRICFTVLLPVK